MKGSLCSGNSEVLKNPQGASYLSKLGCGGQYSPEAQDQVFPLDAMRIIGGLERKQRAGHPPVRNHPNAAISRGCITSSPARQQQCQSLQLAWHQPVSLGTTAHSSTLPSQEPWPPSQSVPWRGHNPLRKHQKG